MKKIVMEKKYVYVSLAQFEEDGETKAKAKIEKDKTEDKINDAIDEKEEIEIEKKLINQIIHQIERENINQAHFNVKEHMNKKTMWCYSIWITIYILMISYILNLSEKLKMIVVINIGEQSKLNYITYIVVIALTIFFIYKIIKAQKEGGILKKISVGNNEIETKENAPESYFDKYLNEVIYIFKNSEIDVVVFEDIDRFDNKRIFNRLMEINKLINAKNKKDKEPIRFFYLVRDELFTVDDKTKFFDFIIPIIPVVHGSNAHVKFRNFLPKEENNNIEERFLRNVSLYINNMRIIRNICNEYIIYKEQLKDKKSLEENKLFAMVVYKNMLPEDFAKLQNGEGLLVTLFREKEEEREREKESAETREREIRERELRERELREIERKKEYKYYPLLKFIVDKGYISKDYENYIAYFYEGKLTFRDEEFIKSIRRKDSKPYNYKLNNPEGIIELLYDEDFKQDEILNIDLLLHLGKHYEETNKYENEKYKNIIEVASKRGNEYFIFNYMDNHVNIWLFIKKLYQFDEDIYEKIIGCENKKDYSNYIYKKTKYIMYSIIFMEHEVIDIEPVVENYIAEHAQKEYELYIKYIRGNELKGSELDELVKSNYVPDEFKVILLDSNEDAENLKYISNTFKIYQLIKLENYEKIENIQFLLELYYEFEEKEISIDTEEYASKVRKTKKDILKISKKINESRDEFENTQKYIIELENIGNYIKALDDESIAINLLAYKIIRKNIEQIIKGDFKCTMDLLERLIEDGEVDTNDKIKIFTKKKQQKYINVEKLSSKLMKAVGNKEYMSKNKKGSLKVIYGKDDKYILTKGSKMKNLDETRKKLSEYIKLGKVKETQSELIAMEELEFNTPTEVEKVLSGKGVNGWTQFEGLNDTR